MQAFQVTADRHGFRQKCAIVEFQHRHPAKGIHLPEFSGEVVS